ncbi:unnamed protein product [Dovyalis caffra]|uniref:Uncharacterized protein n=1 Tax=Dovyalis caffra TaxID=77055 RepID=A0AAV1RWJ9_9ROSI|nr:unnamed protein product [Dovyalis caffra]
MACHISEPPDDILPSTTLVHQIEILLDPDFANLISLISFGLNFKMNLIILMRLEVSVKSQSEDEFGSIHSCTGLLSVFQCMLFACRLVLNPTAAECISLASTMKMEGFTSGSTGEGRKKEN